jgi:hypothetical protein
MLDVDDPLSVCERHLRASCREVADEEIGEYRDDGVRLAEKASPPEAAIDIDASIAAARASHPRGR